MPFNRSIPLLAAIALVSCGLSPRAAQAGPLIDWLFGRYQAPAYPVGAPVPVGNGNGYAANYGTYYSTQLPAIGPAGAGYSAPMPNGIAAATLPSAMPPTLSYVPNFQTQAQRTPVTYYRPILTTDPNTGAQVVAMAPCTSYEMLSQRTPAFGRNALFGSNYAPTFQPPSQALPTYTLPSGGIPLAYSSPSITAPYSTAYGVYGTNDGSGGYSVLQPAVNQPSGVFPGGLAPTSVGPAGAYPTTPLSQSTYYGSTNGGSSGGGMMPTPWQTVPSGTVPGLVAPPAPTSSVAPSTSYPANPIPGYNYVPTPNGFPAPGVSPPQNFNPSNGSGNTDPGNIPPTLPPTTLPPLGASTGSSAGAPPYQSELRPKLRSVVRFPNNSEQPQQASSPRSDIGTSGSDNSGQVPAMLPIPAPEGFSREPRWNPGLLREEDMTARRPQEPSSTQWAGQSKPIVWASFESTRIRPADPSTAEVQPAISQQLPSDGQLRPIHARADNTPNVRRDASGWKASR